jgi:iron(III) transport system ATP-binding protein
MDQSYFDDRTAGFGRTLRARAASWIGRRREPGNAFVPRPGDGAGAGAGRVSAAVQAGAARRDATSGQEALALERVVHRYGSKTALADVSLSVSAGEILCLCGPSGCGKSTLLRLAAGLETLQQGSVRIGGRVVADATGSLAPERRGVGLVFQDYALFPHLSVLANIRFGLSDLPPAEQRGRALAALEQVGMADYADAYPHALSGGQQQRVALARALAPNPSVLLLDEPFSGLDARLREQVRNETLLVLKRNGVATLLVTHDPEEAMFLGDRIALMNEGRVVQVGSPVDLYTRPAAPFAATFFGEANRISGTVREGRVETPLGPVPAVSSDGTAVEVLIRPEALRLSRPEAAGGARLVRARVEAARLLGRASLIHLSVPDGMGGNLHLHARVPGQFLPSPGSHVFVDLDETQTFVFDVRTA